MTTLILHGIMSLCATARRRPRLALVLALAGLAGSGLSGCSLPPASPSLDVAIAQDVVLVLPSPADLGRRIEAVQRVTARRAGDTHVFEARLSVDAERLMLVGTDSLGRRAMTIQWRPGAVTVDKADWVPDTLRPENVLADIVLLYWPEAVLKRAVRGAPVRDQGHGRRIGDAIRVNWDGDPWSGRARLINASFGYELDVRSTTVAP